MAATQREAWITGSWDNGIADKEALAELRVRADAYMAIVEVEYERICEVLGEEPVLEDAE